MAYISDKRLLLTEDGRVVEENDPQGVKLLVAAGGTVSNEDVEKYNLTGLEEAEEGEDKTRPKKIEVGSGEQDTASLVADEEEINLGSGEAPKKSSKKKKGA